MSKSKPPKSLDVTVRGIDLSIPTAALDDFELVEDVVEAQELESRDDAASDPEIMGRIAFLSLRALRRLLPESEMAKAKAALRDPKTGRVSNSGMLSLLGEIFEAANPNS